MKTKDFDTIYKNVPSHQKEQLRQFRSTHPYSTLIVDSITWEYLSCGKGRKDTLVLLPGGIRFAETWFHLITALESKYHIISPTYPAVSTMADLTKGIAHILEREKTGRAHILGTSFGGWVAQCFIRLYPEKVEKVILSNTSGPSGIPKGLTIARAVLSFYPTWLMRIALRKRLETLLSVPASQREFWKAFLEDVSLRMAKEDILAQQECTIDFLKNYPAGTDWPGEMLIMESDDDPAFGEPARKALKALYPAAQVHTFHNAGHTPGYTDPETYVSLIRTFLSPP